MLLGWQAPWHHRSVTVQNDVDYCHWESINGHFLATVYTVLDSTQAGLSVQSLSLLHQTIIKLVYM